MEVEVVATVVRGSRNRAGGGPALTDYGLASRRQPVWWGAPGVVVLFPSRLLHSFSFPRLPALPCYALPLALSSPTLLFSPLPLYTRVRSRSRPRSPYRPIRFAETRRLSKVKAEQKTASLGWKRMRTSRAEVGERRGRERIRKTVDEIGETILRNRCYSSATCRFDTAVITAKGLVERLAAAQ